MNLKTMNEIIKIVEQYGTVDEIGNNEDLNVFIETNVNDEDKEMILSEMDMVLPENMFFSHTYEDDKLNIEFKNI